jgi:hypothetical protein
VDSGPPGQRSRAPHRNPEQDGPRRVQQASQQGGPYHGSAEYVLVHFYYVSLAFQYARPTAGVAKVDMPNMVRIRMCPATLVTIPTSAERRLDR